jgi:hypothetical protein
VHCGGEEGQNKKYYDHKHRSWNPSARDLHLLPKDRSYSVMSCYFLVLEGWVHLRRQVSLSSSTFRQQCMTSRCSEKLKDYLALSHVRFIMPHTELRCLITQVRFHSTAFRGLCPGSTLSSILIYVVASLARICFGSNDIAGYLLSLKYPMSQTFCTQQYTNWVRGCKLSVRKPWCLIIVHDALLELR